MRRITTILLAVLFSAGVGAAPTSADDSAAYRKQIQDWRAHRTERLKSPNGWLTLVGLDWLKDGANRIGSAKDNAIVIAKAPAHLGTIMLDRGRATLSLNPRADAKIDGEKKSGAALLDDSHEKPTAVSFSTVNFFLVQRGDKFGLRIKDSAAPTRTHFLGVDNFAIDPSWRIEAKWEAYNPPHEVEQANIIGQIEKTVVPGAAVFERDGKTWRLEPSIETPGDTNLFLVFADRTSGKETYGAARFLYTDPPKDGKVVLDFNKAYNPPCAFTPFATCPLPTPQNRLGMRVTAGEKKYRGNHE
ncbi:MAG TPA: DUF1684 domain-containing protein [Rudaea sp.]|uniref:DUF1684 domain-containing protein n=1 Tax=Rudaea sp. TaxID=2136325 RepID=UPI002F9252DA